MMKILFAIIAIVALCACSNGSGSGSKAGNGPGNSSNNPGTQAGDPAPNGTTDDNHPSPPPGPLDPAQVRAIRASDWSRVKFAFCSAQGAYGVLVDFQGADLSTAKSGNFKFAVRPCDGSKPFIWRKIMPFTSTSDGKAITFNFGNSLSPQNCYGCGDDTLQSSLQLGSYNEGYGVMGGNSGPCALLENAATGGLFENEPMFQCK